MSRIKEIQSKIQILDGGAFQSICDDLLVKKGYTYIHSLGSNAGTNKTTKGTPDTYFKIPFSEKNEYIFVAYTTERDNLFSKIKKDIKNCMDSKKSGVNVTDIKEIIYCHTSSNITAGQDNELYNMCKEKNILLSIYGIDRISFEIKENFPIIAKDHLSLILDTEQIFSIEDFIKEYNSNKTAVSLDTEILFRDTEIMDVLKIIDENSATIIYGASGVGKTKLALECCRKYQSLHSTFQVLCIKNNNMEIYEDLKLYLQNPGDYLLFIDDVNMITQLSHILQYLNKSELGYNVKIISTVRDYAHSKTIKEFNPFCYPKKYELKKLTNENIQEIVKKVLEITNPKYLERIVKISEGNPRIALMAGKIAKEKNSILSIDNVEQLYDNYFGNVLNNLSLEDNEELLKSAGVLSFLGNVDLRNRELLTNILLDFNLTFEQFFSDIKLLHKLELVDMIEDRAAKISEQCMGNYLIYNTFIKNKYILISTMIKHCFIADKEKLINSINVLLNLFYSDEMFSYLKEEITIVWNDFKDNNPNSFDDFVRCFCRFKEIETLGILNDKIESIEYEDFDVSTISFEEENKKNESDYILDTLGTFSYSENVDVAIDLILKYYNKKPRIFARTIKCFTSDLGIDKEASYRGYYNQIKIFEKLYSNANGWKDNNFTLLVLNILKEYLKIYFTPTESTGRKSITFYKIPLVLDECCKKFRKIIWQMLLEISEFQKYKDRVKTIIGNYDTSGEITDIEIIKFDREYLLRFISIFDKDSIKDCLDIEKLCRSLSRKEISISKECTIFFENRLYKLLNILKGNKKYTYKENERDEKNCRIISYINTFSFSDYEVLLNDCNIIKDFTNDYDVSEGLFMIFKYISKNSDLYYKIIEKYIVLDTPFNLYPDNLMIDLIRLYNIYDVENLINKYEYKDKCKWIFSFFNLIPEENINEETLNKLYDFLRLDEKIESSSYRNINFLDKYRKIDSNVFVNATNIINSKYETSTFVYSLYMTLLFNKHTNTPEYLIERYLSNMTILKETYRKMIEYKDNDDYDNTFIKAFIEHDITFIDLIIDLVLSDTSRYFYNHEKKNLSFIWEMKECTKLIDYISEKSILNENIDSWKLKNVFLSMLEPSDNKSIIETQDLWITDFITSNNRNERLIIPMFSAISEFSDGRKLKHLITFISNNKNFDIFKKLSIEPSHWGGWGSMIPVFEKRILHLESILPYLTGLDFLEHKKYIIDMIDSWKIRINKEKIEDFLEN